MKFLITLIAAGALFAGVMPSSEAARVGSGRSFGVQRAMPPASQRIAPAQQAPQAAQKATPQPSAPQQPAGNRWLGPLAGLAAGLGLGWLLSQGGFGGMLGAVMVALLVGFAVFALLRLFARPRPQQQYAAEGAEPVLREASDPRESVSPVGGMAVAPMAPALQSDIVLPKDFDAAGFIRQAKLNFIRLQEANDRRDLQTLREVTTDPMYDALVADLPPGPAAQPTDVVNLDASLLEVTTEGENHWASVRFQGTIREDGREPAPFQEVWHLQKPVSGNMGWLLAGIQQVS
jgi:predicted lipid-binding transport protein (Tim44 family)